MGTRRSLAIALAFVGLSCGTPAPEPGFSLESTTYTLMPGQEDYFCFATTLDEETAITAFRPRYGEGAHHVLFGYTLAREPEGFSECRVLAKDTWVPLYFGGPRFADLELPDGAAIVLPAGTQIFMQLHLQNTTGATLSGTSAVHLETTVPSADLVRAGVFGLDDRGVVLPAHATDVATTVSCVPGRRMDVFAVLGHMHAMGRRLEVFRGDVGAETLFEQTWYAPEQPTTEAHFTVEPDDSVALRCTHENPSDAEVDYGVTALGEMCSVLFLYTPFDEVDGCVDAAP